MNSVRRAVGVQLPARERAHPRGAGEPGEILLRRVRPPRWEGGAFLDFPVAAIGERVEDLLGLVVADNDLLLGVPFDGAPDFVGNVGDVAGSDRAVGILGRRDGFLAGLHGVDEVTLVAGRTVGLVLAGVEPSLDPLLVGGIQSAPVHVDRFVVVV